MNTTHPSSVMHLHFGGAAEHSASRRPHHLRFGGGSEGAAAGIPGVSASVAVPEPGTASWCGLLPLRFGGYAETSRFEAPLNTRLGERSKQGFKELGLLCSPASVVDNATDAPALDFASSASVGALQTHALARAPGTLTSVSTPELWQPVFWTTASVVARLMSTASVS